MKPLIDKKYKLEKFHGKGGWTFARIPKIAGAKGKLKVKGTIDGFAISQYNLMPFGDGSWMLPVRSEIRKAIGKEEGDSIHVILYPETDALEIPDELMICLHDDPEALQFFLSISDSEKKYYIQWIFSARREETKINRMAKTMLRLSQKLKMYQIE
jgi:hypothetical protein